MTPNSDIVTVTLNPAIDETVILELFRPGAVNRAQSHHKQAGGKGVNIASMLAQFGIGTIATGFLGNQNPQLFEEHFRQLGIHDAFIRIEGETRTSIKIISRSTKETTDINFPGASPTEADLLTFEQKLRNLVRPGRWFVIAGSLPAGVSPVFFEKCLKILIDGGALVAVDSHGDVLKSAIACGVDLIKPNQLEFADILNQDPADLPALLKAAADIHQQNLARIILTLGDGGAIFVSAEGIFKADPPPADVISTVGAGDATLAGYLAGIISKKNPTECAALATVFAWCCLEDVSRRLPPMDDIRNRLERIRVSESL